MDVGPILKPTAVCNEVPLGYVICRPVLVCDHVTVGLQAVRHMEGVLSATVFGQSMHLLLDAGMSEETIRAKLAGVGIHDADIRPIAPSLEDVFVALTGKQSNGDRS